MIMTKGKLPEQSKCNENIGWVALQVLLAPTVSEWGCDQIKQSNDGSNEMAVGSLTFTSSRTKYWFHLTGSIAHIA